MLTCEDACAFNFKVFLTVPLLVKYDYFFCCFPLRLFIDERVA